ncbi:MAG: hypothetical protein IJ785_01115 [Bacteroidales bacterium]|nr:hypothetical protein [Bacteroidales bacterium]
MKIKIFIVAVVVFWVEIVSPVSAQTGNGTSMAPIIRDAVDYINYIEDDLNQEIVRIEFDILQSSKSTIRTLSSGYRYGIVAFGDYRMADIDVKVYQKLGSSWVLKEYDTDTDKSAMVVVQPSYTGEYKIEISCYKFHNGYTGGHYGLIIFHE